MTRLSLSAAQAEFPEMISRTAKTKERTVLSRGGKDVAAVVPIEDLCRLESLNRELTQPEKDRRDIEQARVALAEKGKRVSLRDFARESNE